MAAPVPVMDLNPSVNTNFNVKTQVIKSGEGNTTFHNASRTNWLIGLRPCFKKRMSNCSAVITSIWRIMSQSIKDGPLNALILCMSNRYFQRRSREEITNNTIRVSMWVDLFLRNVLFFGSVWLFGLFCLQVPLASSVILIFGCLFDLYMQRCLTHIENGDTNKLSFFLIISIPSTHFPLSFEFGIERTSVFSDERRIYFSIFLFCI